MGSARGFNGSSEYAESGSAAVTAYPFTLAGFFNVSSADTGVMVGVGNTSSDAKYSFIGPLSGSTVRCRTRNGSSSTATTTDTYSTNTWHHVTGVFTAADDRDILLDASGKVNDATTRTTDSYNNTSLAQEPDTGSAFPNDTLLAGNLSQCAVWDVALSDAYIQCISLGQIPEQVLPNNLKAYWPLWGNDSPEKDYSGNSEDMTLTGTSEVFDGPRVYIPQGAI